MKEFKGFLVVYLLKTMPKDLIIETNALTKSYGPHVALDRLNLEVERGATGLLGPNGAGKSTFFKTILGLIQATSCLLYTSPSPRDGLLSRMPSSA